MLRLPRKFICPKRNQQGIVMVVVAIGALVIVAMAGLALDFGHVATNRARLQNSLDAAALGAARALIVTSSQAQADAAGRLIFKENIEAAENADLIAGGADENNLTIEFSNTVKPFVVDATATNFVRVRMNGSLTYATWFMSVVGQSSLNFNSSAVAGVSPKEVESCDMAPFVVCGDTDPAADDFGYPVGTTVTVKLDANDSDIGPGNFQLARIDEDDAGGADIRENLAGGATACVTDGETLDTEPGNTIGPVAQGLNTRFGDYQGGNLSADQYPPDVIVEEWPIPTDGTELGYSPYNDRYLGIGEDGYDYPIPVGALNRRVMAVPVADCEPLNNGLSTLDVISTMCIFLTEKAGHTGNTQEITVEVIDGCIAPGNPGPSPTFAPGPTKPILYGDADRWDT